MSKERLQKILARAGVASRRHAETLITEGRVRVNGRIVSELGATADARKDRVEVDGKRVVSEKPFYFVLHKPRGMVTTLSDPEGRPHLGEMLHAMPARVYPVGRLDFHTSGVLLVTNDGELTEALLHPRKDVPKVYVAKIRGSIDVAELDRLRNGVVLDDGERTKPCEVFVLREEERATWIQLTLFEGRNRQVHRMCDAIGHPVLRLARTSFAGVTAEDVRPGHYRELTATELDKLKKTWLTASRRGRDQDALRAPTRAGGPKPRGGDERERAPKPRGGDERERAPKARGGDERAPKARGGDERERAPKARGGDERERAPKARGGDERERAPKQWGGASPDRAPSGRRGPSADRGSPSRGGPSADRSPSPRRADGASNARRGPSKTSAAKRPPTKRRG